MPRLTDRERQVLQAAAGGATNREIAQALDISHQTVKNHLHSISRNYGTSGRVQTVIYGIVVGDVWLPLAIQDVESRRCEE